MKDVRLDRHTFHVEVTMEIWWPISVEQCHASVRHLFISVHHAIMFIFAVCVLRHQTEKRNTYL